MVEAENYLICEKYKALVDWIIASIEAMIGWYFASILIIRKCEIKSSAYHNHTIALS